MKKINLTSSSYRKAINEETKKILAKFQQSSKDGNFSEGHIINLNYYNWLTSVTTKNNSLNGYIKYNGHIKEIGRVLDKQVIISNEIFNNLKDLKEKYFLECGVQSLFDLLSEKMFQAIFENGSSYQKDEFLKSFNNYRILSLKDKLDQELSKKAEIKQVKKMKI